MKRLSQFYMPRELIQHSKSLTMIRPLVANFGSCFGLSYKALVFVRTLLTVLGNLGSELPFSQMALSTGCASTFSPSSLFQLFTLTLP